MQAPRLPPLSSLAHDAAAVETAVSLLFEPSPPLATALISQASSVTSGSYASWDAFIDHAERIILRELAEPDQIAVVNAHPAIGAPAQSLSALSHAEQGHGSSAAATAAAAAVDGAAALASRLADLNARYAAVFGFGYLVFVAGRPRAVIADLLERRVLDAEAAAAQTGALPRAEVRAELDRALKDSVEIARSRAKVLLAQEAAP
ncbi:hypothetical protein HK405_007402 [Cladochytrium tenue]|nr:hypothetical protein HK405_007402 [Cladochytrium tenue]